MHNNVELVDWLLRNGANQDLNHPNQNTLLHEVVIDGSIDTDIIELLLQNRNDILTEADSHRMI